MRGILSDLNIRLQYSTLDIPGASGLYLTEKIQSELKLLAIDDTSLLEQFSRYILLYHTHPSFYSRPDQVVVNWYYGDAVYAPLYYGFGGPGEYADRQVMARTYDAMVIELAPDTILVQLRASAEVIRRRRDEDPQPKPLPRDEDLDLVIRRFDEEFEQSLIQNRIVLDTSETTPGQTLQECQRLVEPHITPNDRLRILTHRED